MTVSKHQAVTTRGNIDFVINAVTPKNAHEVPFTCGSLQGVIDEDLRLHGDKVFDGMIIVSATARISRFRFPLQTHLLLIPSLAYDPFNKNKKMDDLLAIGRSYTSYRLYGYSNQITTKGYTSPVLPTSTLMSKIETRQLEVDDLVQMASTAMRNFIVAANVFADNVEFVQTQESEQD